MSFINKVLGSIFGDKNKKDIKKIEPIVKEILKFEKQFEQLSLEQLRDKTSEFKKTIKESISEFDNKILDIKSQIENESDINIKEDLYSKIDTIRDDSYKISEETLLRILPEAFAVIKETAKRFYHNSTLKVPATPFDVELSSRKDYISLDGDSAIWSNSWDAMGKEVVWDMIHYNVQLIGGHVLHSGKIAEMATGEGKTLVSTLPVYLNALTGNGVHVITVNDYLAKRDSVWMAPIFEFHGLSVDCIDNHNPNSYERKNAYNADITYGTNNEFGFDYLRDNMAHSKEELVQRAHNYAIIDEVDSVLIDDARTPLIISGPTPKGDTHEFDELKPKVEKIVNIQKKLVTQTLSSAKKLISQKDKEGGIQLLRAFRGLPKSKPVIKYLGEEGIKILLQKTENIYMADNNRLMPEIDSELYFVIDEKTNSVELTNKGVEYLSDDNDPDFFVMPDIATEITNIDKSPLTSEEKIDKKDDLFRDFSIKSERIHTLNQLLKAYTLFEKDTAYVVMDSKVKIVDEQTGRVMDGRRYSDGLHQAIEAKENVKIEDSTQTFANITLQNYFRMYRKLSGMTGTAETEAGEFWEIYKLEVVVIPTNRPIVRDDRQDFIFKTKREKYNSVIKEVIELTKKGRPVLVGTTSVEISELLSRTLKIQGIQHNVLNAKQHKKESEIVAEAGNPGVVTIATNMAGRGTDIKLSKEVLKNGGLAIIGTERHDSRRVDRQLRGRAGRQGDVGSSQFYVSLEDNLMRLFGSDRIAKLMDKMGLEDGEVIQHSMVTKSIERAQKKVEENNFGIRKRLLEYDDIMNSQREVIYSRRRNLFGDRISLDIQNMIYDTVESVVEENKKASNFEEFKMDLIRYFAIECPISEDEFSSNKTQEITSQVYKTVKKHYSEKEEKIAESSMGIIKHVYENERDRYSRVVVPFTDGNKVMQIVTDLEKAYNSNGKQLIRDFEKGISMSLIDENWKEHLREMDELRNSVQNAVYEQKDPLVIYKIEAYGVFKQMLDRTNREIVSFLFRGELPENQDNNLDQAKERERQQLQTSRTSDLDQIEDTREPETQKQEPIQVGRKIGRNEVVIIRNIETGEQKDLKFKKALPMLESGKWILEN